MREALHPELEAASWRAARMEHILREARYVLQAIEFGGMLDALPEGDDEASRHNCATGLLSLLQTEIERLDKEDGCELSITLGVLAREQGVPTNG